MLSNRLFSLIALYCKFIAYLGVIPFEWCPMSRSVIPSKVAIKKAKINTLVVYIWAVFMVFQLIRFYIARDFNTFNIVLTCGVGNFIVAETFSMLLFREHESRILVNTLFTYLNLMNRKKSTSYIH